MKLYDALRQLLGEYGKSVIREKRLAVLLSGVLGMGTVYRVKVPNSPAGGKSQRIARWSE